jgi:DNA replication protein DnaC
MEPHDQTPPTILRLCRAPADTPTSRNTGLRALALVPENRRLNPWLPRSLQLVEPNLLAIFDELTRGVRPWPLYLHGPSGTGKTSAVHALCDVTATASLWDAEAMATFVMNRDAGEVDEEFRHIGNHELSVLDEIGARRKAGDLAYSVLKRFADVREQRAGRVAVFVSNLKPQAIVKLFDDRIASRLLCGTIYEMESEDRREACR